MKNLVLLCTLLLVSVPLSMVGCGKKRRANIKKIDTNNKTAEAGAAADVSRSLAPIFSAIGVVDKDENPVDVVKALPQAISKGWKGSRSAMTQAALKTTGIDPSQKIDQGYWAVVFTHANGRKIHVAAPISGKAADVTDQACEEKKSQAKAASRSAKLSKKNNGLKRVNQIQCDKIVAAANCLGGAEGCRHLLTLVSVTPAKKSDGEPFLLAYYYYHVEPEGEISEPVELQVPQSLKRAAQKTLKVRDEDGAIISKKFAYQYSALLFNPNLQRSRLMDLSAGGDPAEGEVKNYDQDSAETLSVVPSAEAGLDPGDEDSENEVEAGQDSSNTTQ